MCKLSVLTKIDVDQLVLMSIQILHINIGIKVAFVKIDKYFNTLKWLLIWSFPPPRDCMYVVNIAFSYLVIMFASFI